MRSLSGVHGERPAPQVMHVRRIWFSDAWLRLSYQSYSHLFIFELDNVAGNNLFSFSGFHLPVDQNPTFGDGGLCFTAGGNQSLELQDLIELNRLFCNFNFFHS